MKKNTKLPCLHETLQLHTQHQHKEILGAIAYVTIRPYMYVCDNKTTINVKKISNKILSKASTTTTMTNKKTTKSSSRR